MDWIRKNKVLAGFTAFVVVGAGLLIYLLVSSLGDYGQIDQDYQTSVTEMKRLRGLQPFPDQANLKRLEDERQSFAESVAGLQLKLAAFEPPLEVPPPSPIVFQDKLRRVVDDVNRAADAVNMARPDGFYLGFEQYRGNLPDPAAAPALSRQLDAMEDLVTILIQRHVEKLTSIRRAPLPQEVGGGGAIAAPAVRGPGVPVAAAQLVTKFPVEVAFTTQPSSFREVLGQIVGSNRLYVIRAFEIKNEQEKGPARELPAAGTGAGVPPSAVPGAPGDALPAPEPEKAIHYVVGQEKLNIDLRIDLVRVSPPAAK